jgi:hypothetical protein
VSAADDAERRQDRDEDGEQVDVMRLAHWFLLRTGARKGSAHKGAERRG